MKRKCDALQAEFADMELKLTHKDQEIARSKLELAAQIEITESLRRESSQAHASDTVEISNALKLHEQELLEKVHAARLRESSLQSEIASLQVKCKELKEEVLESRREIERLSGNKSVGDTTKSLQDQLVAELEQKNSTLHRELTQLTLQEGLKVQALELELEHCRAELLQSKKMRPAVLTSNEDNKQNEACRLLLADLDLLRNENSALSSDLAISKTVLMCRIRNDNTI